MPDCGADANHRWCHGTEARPRRLSSHAHKPSYLSSLLVNYLLRVYTPLQYSSRIVRSFPSRRGRERRGLGATSAFSGRSELSAAIGAGPGATIIAVRHPLARAASTNDASPTLPPRVETSKNRRRTGFGTYHPLHLRRSGPAALTTQQEALQQKDAQPPRVRELAGVEPDWHDDA